MLVLALVASLAVAALFATRAVRSVRRSQSEFETIRPWMSVLYVAHSKHVPQGVLWKALGLAPHAHDRRPLARIAREQGRSVEELITALRTAIADVKTPGVQPVGPPQ